MCAVSVCAASKAGPGLAACPCPRKRHAWQDMHRHSLSMYRNVDGNVHICCFQVWTRPPASVGTYVDPHSRDACKCWNINICGLQCSQTAGNGEKMWKNV